MNILPFGLFLIIYYLTIKVSEFITYKIFIAIQFEEKDLDSIHGRDYAEYKKKVPMIFPFGKKKKLEGAYDQVN